MNNLDFKLKLVCFLLCFFLISNVLFFVAVEQVQAITICLIGDADISVTCVDLGMIVDYIQAAVSAVQLVANVTGADWLGQLAQQFQTLVNFAQVLNFDKENYEATDQVMREVLRLALNEFHRLLISFINSKGDPKVIKNFGKEFQSIADKAAGEMLNAIAGANLCNKNWGTYAKLLYLTPPKMSDKFKCSLSDIARQAKKTGGVSVSVEAVGFDEFARMFEPQNNFLGQFLMASGEAGARMSEARTMGAIEAMANSGMKASKTTKGDKSLTDPSQDQILTPGSLIADLTNQGATKDYDLWARQLGKLTPYRGTDKKGAAAALDVVNYILDVANSMASMAIQSGLVNIKENDLPTTDPATYAKSNYNITVDSSGANRASNDADNSRPLSDNLKKMKEELNKTIDKLNEIIPVIQAIVAKEKTLPDLLVSKMNESSGLVCGFSSFNQYLTVSSQLIGNPQITTTTATETQTDSDGNATTITVTTTTTIEKFSIAITDADTGEKYITGAEITKTTTERTVADNNQNPPLTTTTKTINYAAANAGVPGHQATLVKYQDYLAAYKATQAKIDAAVSAIAVFEKAAKAYAGGNCAVATVDGVQRPRPVNCDSLEAAYNLAKEKTAKSVQSVILTISGKYAYGSAGQGKDLDVNANGAIDANPSEKNLEYDIDNLNSELSRHYEKLYGLYQELTKDNMDGGACKYRGVGSQYASGYYMSQGIYKTKYCLNDAYGFANGVSCVQQQSQQ